jgi:hypothetical protein
MKNKYILIIAFIIILAFLTFLFGNWNSSSKPKKMIFYVYMDITEGLPDQRRSEYMDCTNQIIDRFNFNTNSAGNDNSYCNSGFVQFAIINHEAFFKPNIIEVNEISKINDNPALRRKEVEQFEAKLSNTLNNMLNKQISINDTISTVIYRHIIEGINEMNQCEADQKILIIYSDMVEHNPKLGISFIYDRLDLANVDTFKNKISSIYKIKFPETSDLNNIEMYIIRPEHERYPIQRFIIENFCLSSFGKNCIFQDVLNLNKHN